MNFNFGGQPSGAPNREKRNRKRNDGQPAKFNNNHNQHKNKGGNIKYINKAKEKHMQLTKFFSNTPTPNINDVELKKLIESEYRLFIDKFVEEYAKDAVPNRFFTNCIKSERFMKIFKECTSHITSDAFINIIYSIFIISNISRQSELLDSFRDIYLDNNIDYIKDIHHITRFSKEFAEIVGTIIPDVGEDYNPRFNSNVFLLLRTLYSYSDKMYDYYFDNEEEMDRDYSEIEEVISQLLHFLVPDKMEDVIVQILLERKEGYSRLTKNGKNMWNRVTNVTLDILNNMNDTSISHVLTKYGNARRSNMMERRLLLLSSIDSDDYDNISYVANELISKNSEFSKLLDAPSKEVFKEEEDK